MNILTAAKISVIIAATFLIVLLIQDLARAENLEVILKERAIKHINESAMHSSSIAKVLYKTESTSNTRKMIAYSVQFTIISRNKKHKRLYKVESIYNKKKKFFFLKTYDLEDPPKIDLNITSTK